MAEKEFFGKWKFSKKRGAWIWKWKARKRKKIVNATDVDESRVQP